MMRAPWSTLGLAIDIAYHAHISQFDKAGGWYTGHLFRVMARLHNETDIIVAALHDILEDTDWTADALRKCGIPTGIVKYVEVLTRRKGEAYPDYIDRVAYHSVTTRVKIADLLDNTDPARLARVPEPDRTRLHRKYHAALGTLTDAMQQWSVE